jgi:hypothetical protein
MKTYHLITQYLVSNQKFTLENARFLVYIGSVADGKTTTAFLASY